MKYRAICPACKARFPRSYFFRTVPEWKHRCPACGARVKSNSLWEWTGNAICGLPIGILLALGAFGVISWVTAGLAAAAAVVLQVILFPYFTKYDLVAGPQADSREESTGPR